jgi:hypothetical protein
MRDALDILDEMIAEEAQIAVKMAVAFPQDFDRLNAGTGVGIRLQALTDAQTRIRVALTKELEAARLES